MLKNSEIRIYKSNCISLYALKTLFQKFYQPITDTNNHSPEFLNAPYEYNLQMPFPRNFHVDLLGTIAARDFDITNQNITFSLSSTDVKAKGFYATWSSQDKINIKIHFAHLLTSDIIDSEDDFVFDLFAEVT